MTTETVTWKHCKGEAHSNPYIDNCGICAPYWEMIPVCKEGHKLNRSLTSCNEYSKDKFYCPICKKFYTSFVKVQE